LKGIARPQLFDGKDEHWADWKYNFHNVMSLLDITPYLDQVESVAMSNHPIVMENLTDKERYTSKLLHTLLATCLTVGKAKTVFRLAPEANGWEAWRLVVSEYEPKDSTRYNAMLMGVMRPRWTGQVDSFPDELRTWELAVLKYEKATSAAVPDTVKCSVVSMGAPKVVQNYFKMSDRDLTTNYGLMRSGIFTFLTRGRAFGQQGQLEGMPMEVDGVVPKPAVQPGKGKGRGGNRGGVPPRGPSGQGGEIEGWWLRPCRFCRGKHMDMHCPRNAARASTTTRFGIMDDWAR
jgi:hypothetical protein